MSAAEWVERTSKRILTPFQKTCIELLVSAFQTGVYNLPVKWRKVEWDCSPEPWPGMALCIHSGLATWDFNHLTRLVIAAHDACIRVELEAAAPHYMRILMHRRNGREGSMTNRHPTIEQAIANFRGQEEVRPFSEWHDDDGECLWWFFHDGHVQEAPYVGSPMCEDWPGYHTHWTPLPPAPRPPHAWKSEAA
jgi:hypothetical protein